MNSREAKEGSSYVFIDCEFTSIETPALLSIGLVANDGRELYVELVGESHLSGAGPFVLETVASQFGRMPHAVPSLPELGKLIGAWLLELTNDGTSKIDIAYDYHSDFDLLEHALKSVDLWVRLQNVLHSTHIGYLIGQDDVEAAMEKSWAASFDANGIERHHALADARALKAGFGAMHGGGEGSTS